MNTENWKKIKDLFHDALELMPDERERFLMNACRDESMREEVRQLLVSYDADEQFMETVAIGEVAEIIVSEPDAVKTSTVIGRYQIERLLGKGGMGEVYLAQDRELERPVALKILSPLYSKDENRIKRFFQEAKAASALNHPNILTIHEIGRFQDTYYIATEYIKGETLRERANREPLSLSEITEISLEVLSALKVAHEAGIVHRDIKPENIMLRDDGIVKILDFGLAKLISEDQKQVDAARAGNNLVQTAPNVILGTVAYMSPEQARGRRTDERTDLWSFGVCLYELLAGVQPFKDETTSDQIAKILIAEPAPLPPAIPFELQNIVRKALQKEQDARYRSAREMHDDLHLFENSLKKAGGETANRLARRTMANKALTGFSQLTTNFFQIPRRRFWFLFASTVCLLLAVFGFYAFRKGQTHRPNAEAVRWFRSGNEAARRGNYFKAKKMFEQAIGEDRRFAAAHAKLAEMWMELDYEDNAAQAMLRVTELMPEVSGFDAGQKLYLQALVATVRRDHQSALANYEKIAENAREEERLDALFDLAKAHEKVENAERAIEIYEEIIKRDPQFAAVYLRLADLYWYRGEQEKSLVFFEKAADIFNAESDYDGLGELFYQKAQAYNFLDNLTKARENAEKALELGRATSNLQLQVKATLDLARIDLSSGDTVRARQTIDEALQLARTEQLENLTTAGLIDLGNVFYLQGEIVEAEKYLQQALQTARLNGGKRAEARALFSLGNLALMKVKPSDAIGFIKPALDFYSENNFRQEKLKAQLALGYAYDQVGEYTQALDLLNRVKESAEQSGDEALSAHAQAAIGLALIHAERFSEALAFFENSGKLNQNLGREQMAGYDLLNQAQSLINLGRFAEAGERLEKTIAIAGKSSDRQLLAWTHLLKGQLALFENNFSQATEQSLTAIKISESQIDEILITANLTAAQAALRSGLPAKGADYFEKALEVFRKTENPRLEVSLQLTKAEIHLKKGAATEALEAALKAREISGRQQARHSEWRALALAAAAGLLIRDDDKARQYAAPAVSTLNGLRELWGAENYRTYLTRKDVHLHLSRIEKFLN